MFHLAAGDHLHRPGGLGGSPWPSAIYRKAAPGTDPLPAKLGGVWTLWNRLYYIDDFYLWLVKTVQQGIAQACLARGALRHHRGGRERYLVPS